MKDQVLKARDTLVAAMHQPRTQATLESAISYTLAYLNQDLEDRDPFLALLNYLRATAPVQPVEGELYTPAGLGITLRYDGVREGWYLVKPEPVEVRLEMAQGTTISEMRANISREFVNLGDAKLCWVNEGDLTMQMFRKLDGSEQRYISHLFPGTEVAEADAALERVRGYIDKGWVTVHHPMNQDQRFWENSPHRPTDD